MMMKSNNVTIQNKAIWQYFPVVLFIILYKVILAFKSMDGILMEDNFKKAFEECLLLVLCSCFSIDFMTSEKSEKSEHFSHYCVGVFMRQRAEESNLHKIQNENVCRDNNIHQRKIKQAFLKPSINCFMCYFNAVVMLHMYKHFWIEKNVSTE